MDNQGKFVDGDISAGVGGGGEGVMVWWRTDGGVEGDAGGGGDV